MKLASQCKASVCAFGTNAWSPWKSWSCERPWAVMSVRSFRDGQDLFGFIGLGAYQAAIHWHSPTECAELMVKYKALSQGSASSRCTLS